MFLKINLMNNRTMRHRGRAIVNRARGFNRKASIPDACREIGSNAFRTANNPMNQGKLRVLVLGSGLESVDEQAFAGQNVLESIVSYNVVPPALSESGVFMNMAYDNATVSIYEEAESAYKSAAMWAPFKNWKLMKNMGIEDVSGDAEGAISVSKGVIEATGQAQMQVFTLDGRTIYQGPATRVEVPASGMYIVRLGSVSKKVVI